MPEYPAYAAAPVAVPSGGTGDRSLTAYEMLAAGTSSSASLQQIAPGTAGWVLTSGGPGVLASFQPGGGGGGGGGGLSPGRSDWNILGGWVGSSYDPNLVGLGSQDYGQNNILAQAIVAETTDPFNKIGVWVHATYTGTGAEFHVYDSAVLSASRKLASATNSDAVLTSSFGHYYDLTLDATITPAAPGTVYYVVFRTGSSMTGGSIGSGLTSGNDDRTPSAGAQPLYHNFYSNTAGTDTGAVSDPLDLTSLQNGYQSGNGSPFFYLKGSSPPAGGGISGITRMPWNVLGGWSGSSGDPDNNFGPSAAAAGDTIAVAVVTDGIVPFNSVGLYNVGAGAGTGNALVVTDTSGTWVAHGTNVDTQVNNATNDLYYVTLNTTVTPPAAQTVYYVVFLTKAGNTPADLLVSGGQNWITTKGAVARPSFMHTNSTSDTAIASPVDFSTFVAPTGGVPLPPVFALK